MVMPGLDIMIACNTCDPQQLAAQLCQQLLAFGSFLLRLGWLVAVL
jgi:hypothetical protein